MRVYKTNVFLLWMPVLMAVLVSCTAKIGTEPPVSLPDSAPAISVDITRTDCPSIEIQAGMQVSWTNSDDQEHIVHIEGPQGVAENSVIDSGELQPGDSFTVLLPEAGRYAYRCSEDDAFTGVITVILPVGTP